MRYVEIYEYGFDTRIKDILATLECALGKGVSKNTKDVCISEAIGTLETLRLMIDIYDPDRREKEEEIPNVQ